MTTWRPSGRPDDDDGTGATPISAALERVARRLGAADITGLTAVRRAWEGAVGADIASRARPSTLADGVLMLVVDDPAWATQLRFLAADLAAKIDAVAGPGLVTRVEVRQGRSRRS